MYKEPQKSPYCTLNHVQMDFIESSFSLESAFSTHSKLLSFDHTCTYIELMLRFMYQIMNVNVMLLF